MSYTRFESPDRPPVYTAIYFWVDHFVRYLQSSLSPERELPVLVGYNGDAPIPGTDRIILYNVEQLTRQGELQKFLRRARATDVAEVWDYSAVNVRILADHGINARLAPISIPEDYVEKLRGFRTAPPAYDVGFCGSLNGVRRRRVLNAIQQRGLKVLCVTGKSGEERDAELARCRVIINIHFADDYKVYESCRCEPWLAIGVPVVSEMSLDDDPRCINVPYEELVESTCHLVETMEHLVPASFH